jgi:50S ribosomal protein L3, bacterial
MEKAILGKKLGMSQIFAPDGRFVPVTVVEAGPCPVIQVKTVEKDGYSAVKVGFGNIKEKNANKAELGELKAGNIAPVRYMKELKLDGAEKFAPGQTIACDVFKKGDRVDISGVTRGRGFTGTVQRWNAHIGPKAHGSGMHRAVGSMGSNTSPGRVFKHKLMPGHYGHENVTIQNLEIVRVDAARNIILVAGGIPGPRNSLVVLKQTVKRPTDSKWFLDPNREAAKVASQTTKNPQKASAKAANAATETKKK